MDMLKDIVEVQPLENYQLRLRFENGIEGVVDIAGMMRFTGVFAPLKDPAYFSQVRVNSDLGTICWPNGADIDPDVLYSRITGEPITFLDAAQFEPIHKK
jgi:hypothetical protein